MGSQGERQWPVKYEIIAGARRFWTVNWLRKNNYRNFRFFIEVREMTNEEAFAQ